MMPWLSACWDRIVWDLRREFRRLDTLGSMLLFSIITLVVFSFAIRPETETAARVRAGIYWITCLLAGTIGIDRAMRASDDKVLEGELLAPAGRSVLYFSRLASSLVLVLLMESVNLLVFCVLYNVPLALGQMAAVAAVVALTTASFVSVGITLAAMTRAIHGGEVFLRILLLPLIIPVFAAAVDGTAAAIAGEPISSKVYTLIGATVLIFSGAGQILFDHIFADYDGC
jgi:heme exporter protein B